MPRETILIVAAHPDDEVLGCGATAAKHASAGDEVHVLILAEGATSRGGASAARRKEVRALAEAACAAGAAMGAKSVVLEGLPDNRMDSIDRLRVVKAIEARMRVLRPSTVYTHHSGDVNIDHRVCHDAVIAATRPQGAAPVRSLFFFETPSSTEWRPPASMRPFAPSHFVDVTRSMTAKLAALECYESEMRAFPHPRSIEAVRSLASWRGATVGVRAAEAFEVGRTIR